MAAEKKKGLVIFRQNMLAEVWAAHLWCKYTPGWEECATADITIPDGRMLIRGLEKYEHLLVFGGYYRESAGALVAVNPNITFVVSSDIDEKALVKYGAVFKTPPGQFVTTVLKRPLFTEVISGSMVSHTEARICNALDSYLYEYPYEWAIHFHNGIAQGSPDQLLDRLLAITTEEQFQQVVREGKKIFNTDLTIGEGRAERGVYMQLYSPVSELTADKTGLFATVKTAPFVIVLVTEGDSPKITSAYATALANRTSWIGCLLRHDYKANRTFLTVCALKESGFEASELANLWCKGGGSVFIGGGSKKGLLFPKDFFADFDVEQNPM